ncbi:MAG: CRISPR-associated helicase Cas3', partial [bacterium]|nr:CRISPR-associated helicase Cas3' [bacterium]
MRDHLMEVACLAKAFAEEWGCGVEAEAASLMHDLGKYSELFQKVLKGEENHVDHATPGALALLKRYRNAGMAAALVVQGHHEGLQQGNPHDLQNSVKMSSSISASGRTYSDRDVALLLSRFATDGGHLPEHINSRYLSEKNKGYIAHMLYVRMLFSSLVDADYLATEAHFNRTEKELAYRFRGTSLCPRQALEMLLIYKHSLESTSKASPSINSLRRQLFDICLEAGEKPPGIYTLTAPTGTGKTLATLAFALKHAEVNKLRRVIIVLPFLSIIEQTAREYRKVFNCLADDRYILEDHSLVDLPAEDESQLLAENWDAPLVVTTTVKFFEGLFANKSSACRRLHSIAKSVVIFDEAQTMPHGLAVPTLAVLTELCNSFGSSIVFSTATQPAFESLDQSVRVYSSGGWQPLEIVPSALELSKRAKRVKVAWRHRERLSWQQVSEEIVTCSQVLAIVNTRKQAKALYLAVQQASDHDNVFHLSTDMCPAHRIDSLQTIKQHLVAKRTCYLISTQCVEAGVDIDFPVVWRALAPLEAIIQAAGRCNRHDLEQQGKVHVFLSTLEDEKYPGPDYEHGAAQVKLMLEQGDIDLSDPEVIKKYYRDYFRVSGIENKNEKLQNAVKALDFPDVA